MRTTRHERSRTARALICGAMLSSGCAAGAPAIDYEGHRGARGLRPENTIDAFARALELHVVTLEMDCLLTRDDVLVVHHDERLNPDITRTPSGEWLGATGPPIRSLTFAELERFDVGRIRPGSAYAARFPTQLGRDGVRIPALRDVLAFAEARSGGRIRYNLEIKTSPDRPDDTAPPAFVADRLVGAVREAGVAGRTTIQSFDWRALRRVRTIAPELPRSCLTSDDTIQRGRAGPSPWTDGLDVDDFGGSVPRLVRAFGCGIWSPDEKTLSREEVALAHQLGLRVLPWTVNEPSAMKRLLAWGVDGLISDYPDRFPPR